MVKNKGGKVMSRGGQRIFRMVLCAIFAALTAVCSQLSVPTPWGVPISLALLSVHLSGALLGPLWGTLSQVIYVLLAMVGVPVLAEFSSGFSVIVGITGGYILGYIVDAFAVGMISRFWGMKFWKLIIGMVIGLILCYALGTAWFMYQTGMTLSESLVLCVLPYLPGDALKIALAVILSVKLYKQLPWMKGNK